MKKNFSIAATLFAAIALPQQLLLAEDAPHPVVDVTEAHGDTADSHRTNNSAHDEAGGKFHDGIFGLADTRETSAA